MSPTLKNYCPPPLSFQINRGQSDPEAKFVMHSSSYNLLLTPSETLMILNPSAPPCIERTMHTEALQPESENTTPATIVRLKLRGATENPHILALEELPGKVNYFLGKNPDNWRTDIPIYAKVKYRDVYPGIDMIYSSNQQQLKWDFIVSPGANPKLITLDFAESEQLLLDDQGNLLLIAGDQQIRIGQPVVYQEVDTQRRQVFAAYTLNDRQVSFQLGNYDPTRSLIIDPTIEYSTYLGGKKDDEAYGITTDLEGNAYITGLTWSTWMDSSEPGFPVSAKAYQKDNNGNFNAFITKINTTGALVYSTYLGGDDSDNGQSIAVDKVGNAYVTGSTYSEDFPVTLNAIQSEKKGAWDVFVTKLNKEGNNLLYSTYLGGLQSDFGNAIAVDKNGNAYVTGYTESSSADPPAFPTFQAMQSKNNSVDSYGVQDAFVTKINADGSLGYSTYLGGWGDDMGYGITIDSHANAYVTGYTKSKTGQDFPITSRCYQPDFGGGDTDAFITKLNADGSLGYSTYLGGKLSDQGRSIAVDANGNAYVTGFTNSSDFPTQDPLQLQNNGNFDVFVTKIKADGSKLAYSTYLGSSSDDRGHGIAVDENGYVYVTGITLSSTDSLPGFPLKSPLQNHNNGESDAFITKIKPDGSRFIYSTYLGGKGSDQGQSIAAKADGTTYVTGFTFSTWAASPSGPPGIPVQNAIQKDSNGPIDVFVLKLTAIANLAITMSGSPNPLTLGQNLNYHIKVTNHGPDPALNVILKDTLPPDVDFISASTGCDQIAGIVTCHLGILDPDDSATITIIVKPKHLGTIVNTATVTSNQSSPAFVTETTTVIPPVIPVIYTNYTIVTDWRKNPPPCLE